jgi:hypothetical protein
MSRLAILTMRPADKLKPRRALPPVKSPEPVVIVAPEPVHPVVVEVQPAPEPVVAVAHEPEPVVVEAQPEPEVEEAPTVELTREMLNTKTKAELVRFGAEIGLELDPASKKSDLINKIAVAIGI